MPKFQAGRPIVKKVVPSAPCQRSKQANPGAHECRPLREGDDEGSVERFHARLFAAPEDGLHGPGGAGDDHVLIDGV